MIARVKKFVFFPALLLALVLLPLLYVSAHGDGASAEKVVGGYLIDIGYSPADLIADEQTRFDFLLYKAPTRTDSAENESARVAIDFTSVFVRLERDSQLLFAGELKKPEFGETGFSYTLPSSGDYSGYVRYSNGPNILVETDFDLAVASGESGASSFASGLILLVGLIAGVFLSGLFRISGNSWYRRLRWPSLRFITRESNSAGVQQPVVPVDKKSFLQSLLAELIIGAVFAVGAYYATSWYLAGEIKWPDFNFPALSLRDGTDKPATVAESSEVSVVLTERGFQPSELSVKQGTKVTFSTTAERPFWPASNLHPSHELYSAFDPKRPIAANETWSFIFDQVGDWDMHDHLRSYFTGTIHVVQ